MKSVTENVVECVNAILKTLECSICLELLKNPVSTGCGHFFCRFCITETLQSNYRSPCPLCKKSFTRRGIQVAHQRKSILVAAKKLADVCETFADVKFFNKESSQQEVGNDEIMPTLTPAENQSNVIEKTTRTSVGRKRKSKEKEKAAIHKEMNDPLPVLEKIGTDVETLVDAQGDSSDDEAIPTSNKRCRQSVEDSDSEGLPDLKILFQDTGEPKVSDKHKSDLKFSPITTAAAPKRKDFVTNKNLKGKQDLTSVSKIISLSPKTNIKDSVSISPKKNKSDVQNFNKSSKQQIKACVSNCLKIVRKRRFNAKNLKENKNNPLRNKTNELNIDDTTNNNIKIALNVIEEADKNINSRVSEKVDEIVSNEEIIKENYCTEVAGLFLDPFMEICENSDLKNERSSKKRTKTPKPCKKDHLASSSEEEERLTKKINDAENFKLTISKNTIPSTVLVNNSEECYNLNETNIPDLKEMEKTIDVKKAGQSDDIADTAISVQTVASPEMNKVELASRSPGWSKVKQVGKDFRIKKFSKLSVEKNSSNSCPTEITSTEQIKSNTSSSESLGAPKFKKLLNSNVTKDISNEEFSKNSDVTKVSKNSSLENNVACDKQSIDFQEQMPDGEKRIGKTNVSSELGKYDHNQFAKKGEINCQTEINLYSAYNKNSVALEESREVNNRMDKIPTVLPMDCSLSERGNMTSATPVNHVLPDFPLSSISDDRNGTFKSIQSNIFNTGINYEGRDICTNGKDNMEVNNFSADDEYLKQLETEASCIDELPKQIPVQTLPDANSCNEVNNPLEININSHFQDKDNQFELCYVDSVLPSKESFLKPDLKILPSTSMIKDNKLLSKCEITATKSIFDKDENVYYTEHSQQTSQRLLKFCNDGQRKQNSFSESIAALDIPFYCAPNTHGIVAKRNSWYNQVENFNPLKFRLGPHKDEKTKVLKRTCLTLEEIQEAFESSNMSGTVETISSLPFCNDFQLHICVSEGTLNISVLKAVDSEFDAPNVLQVRKTVAEKNIQTSNNNSPVEILPSSNAASDSSQPDQGMGEGSSKMKSNIFPYLSKYFSDSEPVDQPCSDEKESLLNDSEIIPYQGSKQSLNENEEDNPFHKENENDFQQNEISLHSGNNALNLPEVSNNDKNNKMETDEEMCIAMEGETHADIPKLNDSSESLPPTMPYLESEENSTKVKNDTHFTEEIIDPIGEVSEINLSSFDKIVELPDCKFDAKLEKSSTVQKTNQFSKHEENELLSDDEENINLDELVSYQKTSHNIEINDSDGLSSDPAMAFAAQLVAPLKNIAAKMNSAGNENDLNKQAKGRSSPEIFNSREKRPLQEFEELVFNLSKNSANDTSVNKSSRLSLKSKRTAKKFKRIKKFDSDDDSDSAHSSKDELCATKDSSPKAKTNDVQVPSLKGKGNELTNESLQEQSTLNSFLSEDITSKDPNQLAKEVEVLDQEIYSVVEQLKQCGREDVLKRVLNKLHTECEKESPVAEQSDKEQCMSDDSEDSTDIFSQSVPPTPPDNACSKNDSVFKSSHYKHN